MARVENLLVRPHHALGECRRTRDDFERRARWILARNGLVIHRMIGVVVEFVPVLFADTMCEEVRIKGGAADHRKNFARLRIHDHGGCRVSMNLCQLLIHGFFRCLLQVLVDGQLHIEPRLRVFAADDAHGFARDINLHLFTAIRAAQVFIVDLFETEFTDDIARLVALVLFLLQLCIVDFRYIAKDMRAHLFQDVVANRLHLDDHAWIVVLMFLDDIHDVRGHILLHADGVKTTMCRNLAVDFLYWHLDQFRHLCNDLR